MTGATLGDAQRAHMWYRCPYFKCSIDFWCNHCGKLFFDAEEKREKLEAQRHRQRLALERALEQARKRRKEAAKEERLLQQQLKTDEICNACVASFEIDGRNCDNCRNYILKLRIEAGLRSFCKNISYQFYLYF